MLPSDEDSHTFSVNFASGEVYKVGLSVFLFDLSLAVAYYRVLSVNFSRGRSTRNVLSIACSVVNKDFTHSPSTLLWKRSIRYLGSLFLSLFLSLSTNLSLSIYLRVPFKLKHLLLVVRQILFHSGSRDSSTGAPDLG